MLGRKFVARIRESGRKLAVMRAESCGYKSNGKLKVYSNIPLVLSHGSMYSRRSDAVYSAAYKGVGKLAGNLK
jgi:hypothetical protein